MKIRRTNYLNGKKNLGKWVVIFAFFFFKHLKAEINFSELHREKLCEQNLFVLV